jgi:hypothetical protein
MEEILERIAVALERSNEIIVKSVELQRLGYERSLELHRLLMDNTALSIERYIALRESVK